MLANKNALEACVDTSRHLGGLATAAPCQVVI